MTRGAWWSYGQSVDSSLDPRTWTEGDRRYRAADVVLMPYDESWAHRFQTEAAVLERLFGDDLKAIEHVGSKSIKGMSAKPTIDVVADIESHSGFNGLVEQLSSIDYLFAPNPVCAVFRKGPEDMALPRAFHLHVCTENSDYWRRIVGFRDHLRTVPEAASQYEELKRQLARRFETEPGLYTDGKRAFVMDVARRAGVPERD
jgi:GrpB-like predicted nucleotidyltransferase (UPF0157 family)